MTNQAKTRAFAGLAGVITGVMLIGTTGVTFVVGWALWAVALGVLLAAVPSLGEERPGRGRGHRHRRDEAAPSQYSLVR